jgi:hypothetical protein
MVLDFFSGCRVVLAVVIIVVVAVEMAQIMLTFLHRHLWSN